MTIGWICLSLYLHCFYYILVFLSGWVVLLAGLQMDHYLLWPALLAGFCLYASPGPFVPAHTRLPAFDSHWDVPWLPPALRTHWMGPISLVWLVTLLVCFCGTIMVYFRTGNAVMDHTNIVNLLSYLFEAGFESRWDDHIWGFLACRPFVLWAWNGNADGVWELFEIFMTYFDFNHAGLILSTLTCFLYTLILFSSRAAFMRSAYFYFFYLGSVAALLVCFLTDHFFIFYLAFEFILIPFFFIVGFWGSRVQRFGAAMRLVFFTVLFSLPLVVIIFSNFMGDLFSFRFEWMHATLMPLGYHFNALFYTAAFLAFAVKIPLFPAHVWLPEAHGEAPTFGSVLLAGILLKLGGFGFLQVCFPAVSDLLFDGATTFFPLVYTISVLTILYSNVSVFVQTDIKKTIAYYSIGHMGFVTLGLAAGAFEGYSGAVVIMLAHGLSAAGLFFAVGYLYEMSHSRALFYYRGLATIMPFFGLFFFLFICANMGLPGTLNFVGEQLVLASLVKYSPFTLVLPLFGVLMNGISSVLFLNRLLFGEVNGHTVRSVGDIQANDRFVYALVAAPLVIIGFFPSLLLAFVG
jgi:NADH-quinone oxidoreductase subunit M